MKHPMNGLFKNSKETELNEGREQIKRKYGEHGSIKVNETAPVRNEIVRFVGKRFVTEEELKNFLTKLSESRGKDIDASKWFSRNEKYFESFQNRGQQVWTLSKFGKRVLEFIKRKDSSSGIVNESTGLFKSSIYESSSDYSNIQINEAGDLAYWKQYEVDDSKEAEGWENDKVKSVSAVVSLIDKCITTWNKNASKEGTDRVTKPSEKHIGDLSMQFFKKFGYINGAIIQAMIMQES
jgi:hypothetical protein